ncbi:SpoIIE family protein phosphatase [Nocardia fluminea]|uniref:Sigma-B regulation protein RsbU (Phosphoserine phosphatase) n=1 Tax=Nocardia fluminea TaxID=134984 RepID=A0A2N3WXE8_9NOCA|nr:SpoIIE family protein phosphatase [Nocardia fluminea]PKV98572.1 sigma-B regulation protein RsbU (phosphoserine phosphatase) [Nocardia fluminea]
MMTRTEDAPDGGSGEDGDRQPGDPGTNPSFSALLEDSVEDLYENAPCGYLSTLMDGTIAKINTTLLGWLGYRREELVGQRYFFDLLTVGGRMYYETHLAPMLSMHGQAGGLALELLRADGTRLPILVTSVVKTGPDGTAQLIRTTIFDATDRRAYEQELQRARAAADQAREAAERERERVQKLATTLQRTLLPPTLPQLPGMEIAAYYHPASTDNVGGDFYDLFPLTDATWGFFLGDVSGKGPTAAAVTSLTRYTLRAAAVYDPDPKAVLDNLNTVLLHKYRHDEPGFCTVVYGSLRPEAAGATLTLASGGHTPALLVRADGTTSLVETPGGMLVGAIPDPTFVSAEVHLQPGDTVLFYTDGLTEARTRGRERFSEEQLRDYIATHGPTTASGLIGTATDLLTGFGDGVEDDTALLAMSIPPAGGRSL